MSQTPLTLEMSIPVPSDAGRVLVVDDSRLQRTILAKLLRKWGYATEEAASGEEALEIVAHQGFDFVISDWMMPGMSGPEFCRNLRAQPSQSYCYFVLLTSKSEKEDVAQGLDSGADDFLTKPVNGQELKSRLNAGGRIVAMERELQEKNRLIERTLADLQKAHDEIDADLLQARQIQKALIPVRSQDFDGARVSLLMHSCGHVGGDLVGMFEASKDKIGFFSLDVSGHGITSAMMTARVAGYLNARFPEQNLALEATKDGDYCLRPPEDVALLLNQRLDADPGVPEYLTMAYAAVDLSTGLMRVVQAGHPPPLIWHADGSTELAGRGGLPIGLVSDARYDGFDVQLRPGDRVLMYSDGFTECIMSDGEMLEETGLERLIAQLPRDGAGTELLDDLYWMFTSRMANRDDPGDDVSMAMLEYRR